MIAAAAAVPAPDRDLVGARLDEAIDRAAAVGRDDYQAWALGSAVRSLLPAGDLARAQRAAGQVRSNDGANRVESIVESARERTSALSPVERHLITLLPKDNYAFFSVYYMPTEEAAARYADSMIESAVRESGVFEKGLTRSRLLELVLSDCCLLHRTGGAAVIGRVIDAIRDHDARFERAGLIIAARRAEGAAMA
jgi:hypothetical protein